MRLDKHNFPYGSHRHLNCLLGLVPVDILEFGKMCLQSRWFRSYCCFTCYSFKRICSE